MSLEEEIRKKFGKMQKVAIERLHPPMAPKVINRVELSVREDHYKEISSEKSVGGGSSDFEGLLPSDITTDSKLGIDYEKIARSSEFQRFIYFILTGKTHRGSLQKLKQEVKIVKSKYESAYKGVMSEFKSKVERMRKK